MSKNKQILAASVLAAAVSSQPAVANNDSKSHSLQYDTRDVTGQLLHIGDQSANASLGVVNHGRETGGAIKVTIPVGQNGVITSAVDKSRNEMHAILGYGHAFPHTNAYTYGTVSTAQEEHFGKRLKAQGVSAGVSYFPNNEKITSLDAGVVVHGASNDVILNEKQTKTSSVRLEKPAPNIQRTVTTETTKTDRQIFVAGMTGYTHMGLTIPVGNNGELRTAINHKFGDNGIQTFADGRYTHYFNDDQSLAYIQADSNKRLETGFQHQFNKSNWSINGRAYKTNDDMGGAIGLTYHFGWANSPQKLRAAAPRNPEDARVKLGAHMNTLNTSSLDAVKNINNLGRVRNVSSIQETVTTNDQIIAPKEISDYLHVVFPLAVQTGETWHPIIYKLENPHTAIIHSSDENIASVQTRAGGVPYVVFHKSGTVRISVHIPEYYDATTNEKYKAEEVSSVITIEEPAPQINVVKPNIEIAKIATDVTVGDTDRLIVSGDNVKVRFVSTNPNVASIDQDGNIVYHQKGEVKFHAIFDGYFDAATNTQYDDAAVYTHTVSVKEKVIQIENVISEINLAQSLPTSAKVGDTFQLNVMTNNTGGQSVISYKSSNEKVLTVDETGLVTFVGEGTASITVDIAPHYDGAYYKQYSANKRLVGSVNVSPTIVPPTVLPTQTMELTEKQWEWENYTFDINYLLKNGWEIQEIGKVVNQEGETKPEGLMEINTTTGIISFFQHKDEFMKPYGTKNTYIAQVTYFNKKENKLLTITYNYYFSWSRK